MSTKSEKWNTHSARIVSYVHPKTRSLRLSESTVLHHICGVEESRWTILIIFASLPNLIPTIGRHIAADKDAPAMPVTANGPLALSKVAIAPSRLKPNPFSLSIYGDPATGINDLLQSIRDHGILVAIVVTPEPGSRSWEVISGHRRLACALALGLTRVPCEVRPLPAGSLRSLAVLEYNRQRCKTFSQQMREADALEELWEAPARSRRLDNLRRGRVNPGKLLEGPDRRNSDDRMAFRSSHEGANEDVSRRSGSD